MLVLGLETSCDETGVALYDSERGLLGHRLHSQVDQHAVYGGVVPELASRDHIRKLSPLVGELMQSSRVRAREVHGVAYTAGPGLVGALLVGAAFGRSLAYAWDVPAVGVHHMEGHLLAPMLESSPPEFPFVALLVSGGHSELVRVDGVGLYRLLGQSVDDAVGEAFDKTAKLLGLPYPGGPALEQLALAGDPSRFDFPRPMTTKPGLDMSFSGLKTAAITAYKRVDDEPQTRADIARAFQDAAIDTLVIKCQRTLRETGIKRLIVAGGVGANRSLRAALAAFGERECVAVHFPRIEFCTDNGAMIAFAGCQRLCAGEHERLAFGVRARWSLADLAPPG